MRPVIDMIPKKAKIILVLESPYKDEVIHGHPLAGATGQAVTKYIKGRAGEESPFRNFQGPFGCELVRALDHVRLGIMNASLWPLDYRCYCYDRYHRHRINQSPGYHQAEPWFHEETIAHYATVGPFSYKGVQGKTWRRRKRSSFLCIYSLRQGCREFSIEK